MTHDDLLAQQKVADLVLDYARVVDERSWDEMRDLFTEEVFIDASVVPGTAPAHLTRDEWVARARSTIEKFDTTLHYITNMRIRIDGDEAVCDSYAHNVHGMAGSIASERYILQGTYQHTARLTDAGWRLTGMRIRMSFRDGSFPGQAR